MTTYITVKTFVHACVAAALWSVIALMFASPLYAATDSSVKTINSLTLTDSSARLVEGAGGPVAIYTISFSIEAFNTDISIPKSAVSLRAPIGLNNPLRFGIDSRYGMTGTGFAGAVMMPHASDEDPFRVEKGTTGGFTVIIAYAAPATPDRLDRARITSMPLTIHGSTSTDIVLNESELNELVTDYISLQP